MANRCVVGKVMLVLELPDAGIPRVYSPSGGASYAVKPDAEIVNEIIQAGISGTGWSSDGIKQPKQEITLSLVYGGS